MSEENETGERNDPPKRDSSSPSKSAGTVTKEILEDGTRRYTIPKKVFLEIVEEERTRNKEAVRKQRKKAGE
jgi:hypothetical protein